MKMVRAKKCREHLEQRLVLTQKVELVVRRPTDNVSKTTHHWGHYLVIIKSHYILTDRQINVSPQKSYK